MIRPPYQAIQFGVLHIFAAEHKGGPGHAVGFNRCLGIVATALAEASLCKTANAGHIPSSYIVKLKDHRDHC